jgi:hypothetical protein
LLASSGDTGTTTAICVPQGKNLDLVACFIDAVVEVVPDSRQQDATHSDEAFTSSSRTDVGL